MHKASNSGLYLISFAIAVFAGLMVSASYRDDAIFAAGKYNTERGW